MNIFSFRPYRIQARNTSSLRASAARTAVDRSALEVEGPFLLRPEEAGRARRAGRGVVELNTAAHREKQDILGGVGEGPDDTGSAEAAGGNAPEDMSDRRRGDRVAVGAGERATADGRFLHAGLAVRSAAGGQRGETTDNGSP